MSEQDDSFFSRWSRRKAQVRQGETPPAAQPAVVLPFPAPVAKAEPQPPVAQRAEAASVGSTAAAATAPGADASLAAAQPTAKAEAPPPTLEDVDALTADSDYSRFIQRDVDVKVKNSAMKKLFSDPHYNVMDGLDTYIDDYNTPDPLPKSMLRQLVQARMLGLLDDDMPEQPTADEAAPAAAAQGAAADAHVEVDASPPVEETAALEGELDVAAAQPVSGPVPLADAVPAEQVVADTTEPGPGRSS